tara:strand:+ start:56 stop:565 length:510 start_codon:yes stop_codon:yes gene_type:complete
MSYKYDYISNLKQLEQHEMEELISIMEKNSSKINKAFEIGTYAGYVTLLLGGYTGNVTTIDYNEFVSPDINDNKRRNAMDFINEYTGPNLIKLFDEHFNDEYDFVYIHRDVSLDEIIGKIKKIQKKDVLVVCYDKKGFIIKKLEAPKRTQPKKTPKVAKRVKSVSAATV